MRVVDRVVSDDLNWIFTEMDGEEYGVDAQAEVVTEDDLVSGRLLGIQIKTGSAKYFREPTEEGWTFRDSAEHLTYWLGHSLPTIVALVDDAGDAYWQAITPANITETKKHFKITVPRNQPFDASARRALITLAGRSGGLIESLPRYYPTLPPDAVRALRRAEQVDALATARLAERLSTGRTTPDITAASVVAARPSWLRQSPTAQELWFAVGGFSTEHQVEREAAEAFELAADSPGDRSARARAFAGLSLLFIDRDAAAAHLHRAKAEGQALLADVGIPALDVPMGDARAFDIPRSMLEATDDQLDTEPTVLNFLAEMALRRDDLSTAVRCRERALAAAGNSASNMHLELARTIWRRALAEGSRSQSELRRAIRHAQAALEERRRWDGPSVEALSVLISILTLSGEPTEAVAEALPASEGGRARDAEAMSESVSSRGALAAMISENEAAWNTFMGVLGDGPRRRDLQAQHDLLHGRFGADQTATWLGLLDEAVDDEMAARCVARLAHLGIWSDEADDLIDRSILPTDSVAVLRAVYRAHDSATTASGRAELEQLAQRLPSAAIELVQLLDERYTPEEAIHECERQATKWCDPDLTLQLVSLLRRHGDAQQASAVIGQSISDASFSDETRLDLCRRQAADQMAAGNWANAVAAAETGLAIAPDADLAWSLIGALHNDGKVPLARRALNRHRPEPTTQDEIRLWLKLHVGVAVTPNDAAIMLSLATRLPDGELRNAVVGMLIREVLLSPVDPRAAYSSCVVDAIIELSKEIDAGSVTGLRRIDDTEQALRQALSREQVDAAQFDGLIVEVRRGLNSIADVAVLTNRPYGAALLHRPAGVLFAADSGYALRRAGQAAAQAALTFGACVVDLSSIQLLNLVDTSDRTAIRASWRELVVPMSAVDDAVRTRDDMRSLAIASYTATLRADGSIERTTLTPAQQAALQEQSAALEASAASLRAERVEPSSGPADDAITIARDSGLPLWCDDVCLRQRARGRGVSAFGIEDLVAVLARDNARPDRADVLQRLASEFVMDLPLNGAAISALAALTDWDTGAAHTTLSRPGWWRNHPGDWREHWLAVAAASAKRSFEALVRMTKAALTGAIEYTGVSFGTTRYQEIVVLALVACHDAGVDASNLLAELAQHANPSLPPKPGFVLAALILALTERGTPDADLAARKLLPGVGLL